MYNGRSVCTGNLLSGSEPQEVCMEILPAMDPGNFVLCLFCSALRLTRRAYSFDVNDVVVSLFS